MLAYLRVRLAIRSWPSCFSCSHLKLGHREPTLIGRLHPHSLRSRCFRFCCSRSRTGNRQRIHLPQQGIPRHSPSVTSHSQMEKNTRALAFDPYQRWKPYAVTVCSMDSERRKHDISSPRNADSRAIQTPRHAIENQAFQFRLRISNLRQITSFMSKMRTVGRRRPGIVDSKTSNVSQSIGGMAAKTSKTQAKPKSRLVPGASLHSSSCPFHHQLPFFPPPLSYPDFPDN